MTNLSLTASGTPADGDMIKHTITLDADGYVVSVTTEFEYSDWHDNVCQATATWTPDAGTKTTLKNALNPNAVQPIKDELNID